MNRSALRALALAPAIMLCAAAYAADTWKVAPAPPASWQRDRLADLKAHRKALLEAIGDKGIAILYAAEPRNYAADVDWPYRQENNFYYLTGIPQEGSILVLIPGAKVQEILFVPPSVPAQEAWTGHILTHDEMRSMSGIETIQDARNLNAFLKSLLPQAESILQEKPVAGRRGAPAPPQALPSALTEMLGSVRDLAAKGDLQIYMLTRTAAEFQREKEFADKLAKVTPPLKVTDATTVFQSARKTKSQREIDLLQHAVDITEEAFQRVMAVSAPGQPEYETQAQFEYTFLRRGGHWGYPCIVASGSNATTLHYQSNRETLKPGALLLIDDAAEFDGYSADVTRTIPVSGKFSKEQADIYRLVYDAQQAGFAMARPGHRISAPLGSAPDPQSVGGAAIEVFKKGLYKLGLITDPNDAKQVAIWFNHGIGHGIGLNVHDPAGPELAPGMVITVEPGIYIRPNALDVLEKTPENQKFIDAVRPAFEKYKGIGVRIEDDLLITTSAPKVMSAGIPSKLEDVEATVAKLRKAVKTTPLP